MEREAREARRAGAMKKKSAKKEGGEKVSAKRPATAGHGKPAQARSAPASDFDRQALDQVLDAFCEPPHGLGLLKAFYWVCRFYPPPVPRGEGGNLGGEIVAEFLARLGSYLGPGYLDQHPLIKATTGDAGKVIRSLDDAFSIGRKKKPWKHGAPDESGMSVAGRVYQAVEGAHLAGAPLLDPDQDPVGIGAYSVAALALEDAQVYLEPSTVRSIHTKVRSGLKASAARFMQKNRPVS